MTLLITLAVIAAMLALVAVLFGYLDSARKKAESEAALIQADLLRKDVGNLLQKYLKGHPSASTLQTFYGNSLAYYPEHSDFGVTIRCSPLLDRVPIVWLGWEEDPKHRRHYQLARRLFDRLTDAAELKEPETFYNLLVKALHGRHLLFGHPDDLKAAPLLMSTDSFAALEEDYRYLADDPNIYRIPWNDYFLLNISGTVPRTLDRDYLNPHLVSLLFDLDPALVREEYTPGELVKFLRSVGAESKRYEWLFAPAPSPAAHCDLHYSFREGQYNVSFDYMDQRILNFELGRE